MHPFAERRFVVVRDIEVHCFVDVTPLLSEHTKVTLRSGEVLDVVLAPPFDRILVLSCRPHRYEALEVEFIDAATRENSTYRGYRLSITGSFLRKHCRPLSEVS
jgi:hypothetical protein